MEKLSEVETAKALMTEAMAWSVMKWLREKKRVRKTADQANAALDQLNQAVKKRWTEDLRTAYASLAAPTSGASTGRISQKALSNSMDADSSLALKRIKEADDEAYRARLEAEETFDEAEKKLSTQLAREGCRKAIWSWELHEKAIRKAEELISGK